MVTIIPRPIRDMVISPFAIKEQAKQTTELRESEAIILALETITLENVKATCAMKIIKAAARTALAAIGTFAVCKFGYSPLVSAAVGSLVSWPVVVIAGGSWLLYHGATSVVAALASGSFATLGIGLASLAAGYISLEHHDAFIFGQGEKLIGKLAEHYKGSLVKAL